MISIFDVENGRITPTKHCYSILILKRIMDEYPDNYMKIYAYLFYMSCPNDELNPFFEVPEHDKETVIYEAIDGDFSLEDDLIQKGLVLCEKLYETPTSRMYYSIKAAMDKMAEYFRAAQIDGSSRDGNLTSITNSIAKFKDMRETFKGLYKDLKEELGRDVRGGKKLSYDEFD